MPPPDKIRPWVTLTCSDEECEFSSAAEWAWMRHEKATGHRMNYPEPWKAPARSADDLWATAWLDEAARKGY